MKCRQQPYNSNSRALCPSIIVFILIVGFLTKTDFYPAKQLLAPTLVPGTYASERQPCRTITPTL